MSKPDTREPRLGPFLQWAIVLWLPFLGYGLLSDTDHLIRFFPDDAFYYLKTADNFTRTGLVSFDGVHATNGFHPLNFVLSCALASLATKSGLLASAFIVDSLFMFLAAWLAIRFYRLQIPSTWRVTLLALVTLPAFTLFVILSTGLEAALGIFCIVSLFSACDSAWRVGFSSTRKNVLSGFVLAAVLLARLDFIISIAPLATFLLARMLLAMRSGESRLRFNGNEHGVRRALPKSWPRVCIEVFTPPAVLLSFYLLLNLFWMGRLVPISGYVKGFAVGETHSWNPSTRGTIAGLVLAILPLASSLVMLAVSVRKRPWLVIAGRNCLLLLNSGNLVFYAYLIWGVSHVFRWYFSFPIACLLLNLVFFAACAAASHFWKLKVHVLATCLLSLCLNLAANAAVLVWIGNRYDSTSYHLKKISDMVNKYGGSTAVTGTLDAGVVGYFASGRVINLDGLANNFAYVDGYLKPRRLGEYFTRSGVTHFLVRDGILVNRTEVIEGRYKEARVTLDPHLVLWKQNELFRYEIPGQFSVLFFRLER